MTEPHRWNPTFSFFVQKRLSAAFQNGVPRRRFGRFECRQRRHRCRRCQRRRPRRRDGSRVLHRVVVRRSVFRWLILKYSSHRCWRHHPGDANIFDHRLEQAQARIGHDGASAKSLDLSPALGSLRKILSHVQQSFFGFQDRLVNLSAL